jgi:hypothetical protein
MSEGQQGSEPKAVANRHHWCSPDEVERVRVWRKLHPFYWKRGRRK